MSRTIDALTVLALILLIKSSIFFCSIYKIEDSSYAVEENREKKSGFFNFNEFWECRHCSERNLLHAKYCIYCGISRYGCKLDKSRRYR